MRVDYLLTINPETRREHCEKMRASYGGKVCAGFHDYGLNKGFCLKVDDVESAKNLALADELCGRFSIFEASSPVTASRTIYDEGCIGYVIPFSIFPRNSLQRDYLLRQLRSLLTHAVIQRGADTPFFIGPASKGKIYSPDGAQLWPVSEAAMKREEGLVKAARSALSVAYRWEEFEPGPN